MHGDGMLANALLLVAIVSVNAQTETNVRIAGPVNNVTLITTRPVNIIVCDASRPAKQIGATKTKQKPSSSSRSRSSLLPGNIDFNDTPLHQTLIEGTDSKVLCQVTATPEPMIDWLKGMKPINTYSHDRFISQEDGLLIKHVMPEDEGVYRCRAKVPQLGSIDYKDIKVEVKASSDNVDEVNCPEDEGFFRSPISNQCLKTFMEPDHEGFWEDADRICKAAGLVLARPTEPVSLRTQLVAKFGDQSYWIGARGDGQQMRWQRNNEILDMRSPFWQPGIDEDYVTTDSCLGLSANAYVLREYPDEPYWSWDCANHFVKFPLCEKV